MQHSFRLFAKMVALTAFVLFLSTSTFSATDSKGRGKLYNLMIKNMVEIQKVIVAMAQNKWDVASKEIEKQKDFADQLLTLYPKKTIEDIREYKKIARRIEPQVKKFQKYASKGSKQSAFREFSKLFSLCLQCHDKFRD